MPAGLTIRKPCGGDLFCDAYQMCSEHDYRCYPCHEYCDETSNNFDVYICEQQCQDYIHDFLKQYANKENIQGALNEFHDLKLLTIVLMLLVAILLAFITATAVFIWKHKKRIRKIENVCQDAFFKKKSASLQGGPDLMKEKHELQQPVDATVGETVDNEIAATCTQTKL